MTRALLLLCACAAALCTTLSQISAEPSDKEKLEMANKVYALLKDKCYSCHGEAGKKAMGKVDGDAFNWVLDYDKLVSTKLLAANDEESELYTSMKTGSMPRDPSNTRKRMKLPQEDIDMVLNWIKAGAPKWDPDAKSLPAPKVAWTELKIKGPDARFTPTMCEGPGSTIVLFGGMPFDSAKGQSFLDTWVFSNGQWSKAAPKTSPKLAWPTMAAMVFDKKRNVSVLVDYTETHTWEWDGTDWKQIIVEGPPARVAFSLAYDVRNSVTLLFGGVQMMTDKTVLNDTWTYDGKVWKKLDLKISPEARSGAPMAYAPASKSLLLFGGAGSGESRFTDTWLFDGKAWTKQAPANSPKDPNGCMAASITSTLLVTHGETGLGTWLWDGKTWLQAKDGPSKRSGFGLAFNAKSKGVVLFGGYGDGKDLGDTWELNATK